ncbi:MAG: hypothetical protein ACFFBD_26620, partial [Candidatus Hodarchaeota archaeon]
SPIKYKSPENNFKDVTIRNVITSVYDEFVSACQLNNQKIGDAVNELLAQVLPFIETMQILMHELTVDPSTVLVITSIDELTVTERDLSDIGDRKVLFHRIDRLEFHPDIDKSLFVKTVIGIYNCENIKLPLSVPKLIELSRIKKYPK